MALLSLVVDIVARTASIEDSLTRVEGRLNAFGNAVKGLVGILGAREIIRFAEDMMRAGEAVENASKRIGVSTTVFQELSYAAKQAGGSGDELAAAMTRMQRALGQAESGASRPIAALNALGLSIKDIQGLKPEVQLEVIAEQLSRVKDPAQQAAIQMQLFGRTVGNTALLLKQGADAIIDAREAAQRGGGVVSEENIKVLKDANQALENLEIAAKNLGMTLVGLVGPGLTSFFKDIQMILAGDQMAKLQIAFDMLTGPITKYLELMSKVPKPFRKLWGMEFDPEAMLKDVDQARRTMRAQLEKKQFENEMESLIRTADERQRAKGFTTAPPGIMFDPEKQLRGITVTIDKIKKGSELGAPLGYSGILGSMEKGAEGAEAALETLEAQTRANIIELAKMKQAMVIATPNPEDFKKITDYYKAYDEALKHPKLIADPNAPSDQEFQAYLKGQVDRWEAARDELQSRINAIQPVAVKIRHLILIADLENAIRGFSNMMEGVFAATLHQSGAFGRNLVRNIVLALEDQAIYRAAQALGEMIFNTLTDAASSAGGGGGGGGWIGAILGGIGTLFGGYGSSKLVPVGSSIAERYGTYGGGGGLYGHYQHGGSFTVGGHGGIDSQLVQFMATPGERVTVGGGGMAFSPTYNIDARGADAERIMTVLPGLLAQTSERSKREMLDAFRRGGYPAPRHA